MPKLFIGIALVLGGICSFVVGFYYGWLSGVPGIDRSGFAYYQRLSNTFGICSYILIGGGSLLIVYAIRKMNRKQVWKDHE